MEKTSTGALGLSARERSFTYDADWVQIVFTVPGGHYVQTRVMGDTGEVGVYLEVEASSSGVDC